MVRATGNGGESPVRLSVVVMAKDEAHNISACLASVDFAGERIVADTGSSDNTRALAREAGAEVVDLRWQGFGPTKAKALALAKGEWVFSLDADERATPALADEIFSAIRRRNDIDGYEIPRRSFFLGREMRHGGWDRDYVLRLVRRGVFHVTGSAVHERIVVEGRTGRLFHPLDHHTCPRFASYLAKMDLYSTLAAQEIAADPSRRAGVAVGLARGFVAFVKKLVVQRGWRDGAHGVVLAVSSGYERFLRYTKAGLIRGGHDVFSATRLEETELDTPGGGEGDEPR
ncbi:MAG: hypothetical protein MAG453_00227 [Calditrichaeota bacterium]|nr:hypothetical protein [Calditrichota bacterium]